MDIELTKDGKKTIARIYKEYLRRKESGENKMQARYFDANKKEHGAFIDSVWEDIPELKNTGLVKAYVTACFELTDKGIVYMENKTIGTIKEWLSFGSNFIP